MTTAITKGTMEALINEEETIMKMTIGCYLFRRLQEIGVGHVFGVPGDFNLQLLEQLNEVDDIDFVGTCNELNASYAADGYARANGIGAMLTTYGVGDLSAICGLAGACAEHVPVVLISGTPPLYAMESRLRVHHSLAEGNFDNISNCLKQFTGNSVRLTPMNIDELDRVLVSCWRDKLPVYIQVPSNISYLEVDVPETPLTLQMPASDGERLSSAVGRITALIEQAQHPLLLIDADADRCGLVDSLTTIAHKRQIPYVAFRTGKGILPESDPLYLGMYNGAASAPLVAEALRRSDCLIATAPCFIESSPMAAPGNNPVSAQIYISDVNVTIEGEVYEGVAASELVEQVANTLPERVDATPVLHEETAAPVVATAGKALTQAWFWQRMASFFAEDDLVCVENGTSLTALLENRFPRGTCYIAQPIWGSIGYSLPALLGAMTAQPQRRALLFIGDGSFQLTAQELSTILNRGLTPIIFLLNNRGYTIERYILGMDAHYNDIADWRYRDLPGVLAPNCDVYCTEVHTEDELEAALAEAAKGGRAAFIELNLAPDDAPEAMKHFGAMTAELDYGPRGPQRQ